MLCQIHKVGREKKTKVNGLKCLRLNGYEPSLTEAAAQEGESRQRLGDGDQRRLEVVIPRNYGSPRPVNMHEGPEGRRWNVGTWGGQEEMV